VLVRNISSLITKLINKGEGQYERNFIMVSIYAFTGLFLMALISVFGGFGSAVIKMSIFAMLVTMISIHIVFRYGEFELYAVAYCIIFDFVIYPLLFLSCGDVYNGMVLFFVLGIVLTFFLTKGTLLVILVILEMIWDGIIIIFAYYNSEILMVYRTDKIVGYGIAASFVIAMFMPIFIVRHEMVVYEEIKEKAINANSSLNNAEMTKSRFLANMTHEIRTPMNAIVGMNELILKENLSPIAREQAETIKKASTELLNIINNILVYSKLDSNKMDLLKTKYNFKVLISDVVQSISKEYNSESSDFHVFIDHNIPTYLYGDDIRIKQVFHYLLFSSMQQLAHGRINLDINVEINKEEHTATLKCCIAETGKGLTEAELSAMFGAYNQYDSRQKSDFKGMGLELFICREILNMMGGSLKIESILNVGMAIHFEFTNYIMDETPIVEIKEREDCQILIYINHMHDESVWLHLMEDFKINPRYVSQPIAFKNAIEDKKYAYIFVPDRDYESVKDTIISAECEEYTYILTDNQHVYGAFGKCPILRRPITCLNFAEVLNNKWDKRNYVNQMEHNKIVYPQAKVLVIDDSLVNIKVMLSLLEKYQIKADMATSGNGGLNCLEKAEYDLLLLDQRMPEMDGIETLHKVRQLANNNKNIPAICITADFGAEVRERLIAEGFQDYIAKPVKIFYLERMLSKYLPKELGISVAVEEVKVKKEEVKKEETKPKEIDPLTFMPERGLEFIGGDFDAYSAILSTYYEEGVRKLNEVPLQYKAEDLSLFTTNVHALKSSSASVGAIGISPLFKELEFAGKEGNRKLIEEKTMPTLEMFTTVLEKVRAYMLEKGISKEESVEEINNSAEELLSLDIVKELKSSLASVNLKRCEEIINSLSEVNYGKEHNAIIKNIKNSYERFEYKAVKEEIELLINSFN